MFPVTISFSARTSNYGVLSSASGSGRVPVYGINHVKITSTSSCSITSNTGASVSTGSNVDVSAYDYLNVTASWSGLSDLGASGSVTIDIVD